MPEMGCRVCFGVGVPLDATHTVIAACIGVAGGLPPLVQIVHDLPGTRRIARGIRPALQTTTGHRVCIDPGPSAALADVLANAHDPAYVPARLPAVG